MTTAPAASELLSDAAIDAHFDCEHGFECDVCQHIHEQAKLANRPGLSDDAIEAKNYRWLRNYGRTLLIEIFNLNPDDLPIDPNDIQSAVVKYAHQLDLAITEALEAAGK